MREAASFIAGQEASGTSFVSSIGASFARLYRVWKTRRRIVKMTDLDDHMLDDIGVSRADLYAVLDEPFSHDPALSLQRIAQHNRSRWKRA